MSHVLGSLDIKRGPKFPSFSNQKVASSSTFFCLLNSALDTVSNRLAFSWYLFHTLEPVPGPHQFNPVSAGAASFLI
jgi:hypothetical protein